MGAPQSDRPNHLPTDGDQWDPAGQQAETIRVAIRGTFGLALIVLAFGAFGLNHVGIEIFGVVVWFVTVAWISSCVWPRRPKWAGGIVVTGLFLALAGSQVLFREVLLTPWLAFVVLVAAALLGWD